MQKLKIALERLSLDLDQEEPPSKTRLARRHLSIQHGQSLTMHKRDSHHEPCAAGYVVLQQTAPHQWIFRFPRLTGDVAETLYSAIDETRTHPARAKRVFHRLIQKFPENMDAWHYLALTFFEEGNLPKAAECWRKGAELALQCLPAHFSMQKDQVHWGFIENRPFLRLYQGYGMSLLRTGKPVEALPVLENLLRLNPGDNQGNRGLAVECCFLLGSPEGVLRVCKRYPQDMLDQVVYGRPLAFFQLGRLAEAQRALRKAMSYLPLIAMELLKTRHVRPKEWNEDRVRIGGRDQAYDYWREHGKFWEQTPGALAWLRAATE